jgi:hypothetical protein
MTTQTKRRKQFMAKTLKGKRKLAQESLRKSVEAKRAKLDVLEGFVRCPAGCSENARFAPYYLETHLREWHGLVPTKRKNEKGNQNHA